MKNYLDLCQKTLDQGIRKPNRTGIDTIGIIGGMLQFHMSDGFPVVTTKEFAFKSCIAEFLGILRGYTSAAQFRELGTKVWDANANNNVSWLDNPHRTGKDDMGRVYGAQARGWKCGLNNWLQIDQLKNVVEDLFKGVDNRREIVTMWNPSELDQMCLPPCHLLYQFSIQGDELCLTMYQRSCDMPLGVPFDIVGYSWLLCVIAQITGLKAGTFTHFLTDIHVYENQVELMKEQLTREPLPLPELYINPEIKSLIDLDLWVTTDDFKLIDYNHHPKIKYPFAI